MKNRVALKKCFLSILIASTIVLALYFVIDTIVYRQNVRIYNRYITKIIDLTKEKYPDVDEREIIKMLEEPLDGSFETLTKYGIDFETTPAIRELDRLHNHTKTVFFLFIIAIIILTSTIYLVYIYDRDREMEKLTVLLERINARDYSLDIGLDTEDELSILKGELYKTAVALKESAENSKKDKLTLKDALSDISHQLKTPLTSIMISLDNLEETENIDEQKRQEFIKNIKRETANINFLVQAILKLSRLDTDTVTFARSDVLLENIIDKARENVSLIADLKNVEIITEGSTDVEVICDFTWQVEAVTNILKNAIEHSRRDEPVIMKVATNKIYTSLSITNRGETIDKKDIPHIFERFYRGKNASPDSVGIGLALAKSIIKNDRGSLEVESKDGETAFTIKYYK